MNESAFLSLVIDLASTLEEVNIPYELVDSASLWLQGVEVEKKLEVSFHLQWDLLEKAYELFRAHSPSPIEKSVTKASFYFDRDGVRVFIHCYFNQTIKTDPYRITVNKEGREIWCRSLYSYFYFPEQEAYSEDIHRFLLREQQNFTKKNESAWNQNNYTALINRYGDPAVLARKIQQNPEWRLHPFYKYMGDISGKRVAHLMGSNGIKAVALSLLGADVTVVDFSQENAAFAGKVAEYADVSIDYIVSDILSLSDEVLKGECDIVLMELGVLHYFIDLQPLVRVIGRLLRPGGKFILHEFHPVSTKLITSTGKKHKLTGNYFDPSIESREVAFSKHMPDEEKPNLVKVLQRKWTIGEVVTAIAQGGLMIWVLEEEPNHKVHDIGLPKTFTLVAGKIE